jgi:hypothetical protein
VTSGLVRRAVEADQLEEGDLGDHDPAPQSDHRQLSTGHQLVGEGPGDTKELSSFTDRQDQAVAAQERGRGRDPSSER